MQPKPTSLLKRVLIITFSVLTTVLIISGAATFFLTGENNTQETKNIVLEVAKKIGKKEIEEAKSTSIVETLGYGLAAIISAFVFMVIITVLQNTLKDRKETPS